MRQLDDQPFALALNHLVTSDLTEADVDLFKLLSVDNSSVIQVHIVVPSTNASTSQSYRVTTRKSLDDNLLQLRTVVQYQSFWLNIINLKQISSGIYTTTVNTTTFKNITAKTLRIS